MKIITGHTGQNHITATDAQAFNQGIFGTGSYVLAGGQQFAASIVDATHVSIADGDGVMQGVHFRIERGQSESVTLDAGTLGMYRRDYICARYEKDATTGVESVSLVVVKGTEASANPTIPTYNTGDIVGGDSPVDYPLYQVYFNGATPTISTLFKTYPDNYHKRMTFDAQLTPENASAQSSTFSLSGAGGRAYLVTLSGYVYDYLVEDTAKLGIRVTQGVSDVGLFGTTFTGTAADMTNGRVFVSASKIIDLSADYDTSLAAILRIRVETSALERSQYRNISLQMDAVKLY
jgi:hypothetical protein